MRSEASPEPRRAAVRRGEWTVALLMALLASCFGIDQTWRKRGGSARAARRLRLRSWSREGEGGNLRTRYAPEGATEWSACTTALQRRVQSGCFLR